MYDCCFLKASLTVLSLAALAQAAELPGFERSPYFDEQVKTYTFDPEVTVHINAAAAYDPSQPTRLVIFALPNGNTIPQTIGCARAPDRDWHFYIQHIGAQTRCLRESIKDVNLVVAYVEAGGRSWPWWRQKHADSGKRIAELIESIRGHFPKETTTVELTAHSGGGSMIFGYLHQMEQIPDWIRRIAWLDANYAYSDEQKHGDKLIAWLNRSPEHFLAVIAYDDRRIKVNGKLVVGPTGGTYRKTRTMVERLRKDLKLAEHTTPARDRFRALGGRVDVVLVENPEDKILHTVLVEKNGFIHALTFGTPREEKVGGFFEAAVYEKWIQPAPTELRAVRP